MALTPLDTIDDPLPSPTRPSTFNDDMDRFINTKLPLLAEEVDAVATAFTLNATNSTSTSSVAIGTGTKNFTVQTGKSYLKGMFLIAADDAAPATNYLYGQCLSYDSGTGALSISVNNAAGSGTKTAWSISQTASGGVTTAGATFTGDVSVPDEAYDATAWNGSLEVPTKNAVRDKIESLSSSRIQPITATVSANALTITLNPTVLDFRSSTLTSGTVNTRTVSAAISVVVSSGSTLGTVNSVQSRLAVLAIDNAGTVELAVVNLAGGTNLDETGLISTTAEGGAGAADSASVIYSTTARSNVPYRVVGFVESTQATAGTWATAPSTIQGMGGQALTSMQSLGFGQTYQDLTASRSGGVNYYNTTGRPIYISITTGSATATAVTITVNGVVAASSATNDASLGSPLGIGAVIPVNAVYLATLTGGLGRWSELR